MSAQPHHANQDYEDLVAAIGDGLPDAERYQRLSALVLDKPRARTLASLDPFSTAYRDAVMALYFELRGQGRADYDAARDELSVWAELPNIWTEIAPWAFQDAALVSEHIVAWGTILGHLGLKPGGRVLEYGPGSGQLLLMLARLGYEASGVDIDPRALALIERQAREMGVAVRTARAGFGEGFADERFDVVLFYESFHHALEFDTLLRCLHGRLRPGGRVVLCGEPIVPVQDGPVPFPWGPRLDGLSVFCMRKFGWMELGFTHDFFVETARRTGWTVSHHPHPGIGRASVYVLEPIGEDQTRAAREALAEERRRALQARVATLEAELTAMRASTSWRLSKPVRTLGRLLPRR